ncbi:general secretion pathway protein GspK [Aerolutibacter ruishenii]|uniref:Type II secretion system protein K n=1 Tax=Aerolutibacter ruishenii TaxID=686800 RepID=A0A562M2Q8_9GAMM|nr:type II secretion system protein GspK [Lysobacter ruishenii]TWI14214.1 general secretion pathway protein K [Lysobacter ruishenii]
MKACPPRHAGPARGAALLLVLWLLLLLAGLIGGFALSARVESMQGQALVRGVAANAIARAGLEYALTRVDDTDPRRRWTPDGRPFEWAYGGATLTVKLVDENSKIDLNQSDLNLLAGLFSAAGEPADRSMQLAAAVLDWRDPDQLTQPGGGAEDPEYAAAGLPYGAKDAELESVAELEQVLGMTPALYAKIEPYLTVHSGRAAPDPAFAPALVLDAMGQDGSAVIAARGASAARTDAATEGGAVVAAGSGTYSIESRARLVDGRESVLRAVVRVGANAVPGMAYTALRWEEGASSR